MKLNKQRKCKEAPPAEPQFYLKDKSKMEELLNKKTDKKERKN
jgi:hypothetical protein